MRAVVLLCIVLGAAFSAPAPKPQLLNQGGAPTQAFLLQGSPQVAYSQPSQYVISSQSSQNAIPAGAQIIYLQSQPQYSFAQGAYPQGQIAYIQGASVPNQQAQVSFQPAQQAFTSYQTSSQYSNGPQQVKYTTQNVVPATQQSSLLGFSAPKQSQSTFTQKTSNVAYKKPTQSQPPVSTYNAQSQSKYGSGASSSYSGSAGQPGNKGYVILKQSQNDNFDGSFNYNYETDHGISVDATGYLKNAGTEDEAQVIQGSYTYYLNDGTPIVTTYIADENGFVAQGDHLPKVPELIAKAIEYQRSLPPSIEDQKK